jgi:hypothetical protein
MNAWLDRLQAQLGNALSVVFDGTVILLTLALVAVALCLALVLMPVGWLLDRVTSPALKQKGG